MTSLAGALWAALLTAAFAAPAPRVRAVIAVVAPADPDPAVMEALSRFRGEAASVGIEVTVVPGSATATAAAQMEAAARAASAALTELGFAQPSCRGRSKEASQGSCLIVATVAFLSRGDPHALDIWFSDRLTGQTVFGHVSVENEAGDRSSTVLAVKAVDFLRARMFDFLVSRPPPATPPPPEPAAASPPPAATSVPARARRVGLSVGFAVLHSVHGLGTTGLPLVRIAYDLTGRSSLRLAVGGFGTTAQVQVMGGSAAVREEVAMAEWTVMPTHARVRPLATLGLGLHAVDAEGSATAPYTAHTVTRASFAAAATAGVRVALTARLAASAEAGAFLLFPEPQVVVAGLDAGRTGRPGLSGAVTIEARF